MGYRLAEVDHRVMHLLERVKEFDADLATELWDAVWEQLLRAADMADPVRRTDTAQ